MEWKPLSIVLLGLLIAGVVKVSASDCRNYLWAPSYVGDLYIWYDSPTGQYVEVEQWFKWDDQHLQAFNELGAYYQYEIRRDKEVWDYWNPDACSAGYNYPVGSYWTNLPNSTDMWTEEQDCGGDEEFELKLRDKSSLIANYYYYVHVEFFRDIEDRASTYVTV